MIRKETTIWNNSISWRSNTWKRRENVRIRRIWIEIQSLSQSILSHFLKRDLRRLFRRIDRKWKWLSSTKNTWRWSKRHLTILRTEAVYKIWTKSLVLSSNLNSKITHCITIWTCYLKTSITLNRQMRSSSARSQVNWKTMKWNMRLCQGHHSNKGRRSSYRSSYEKRKKQPNNWLIWSTSLSLL